MKAGLAVSAAVIAAGLGMQEFAIRHLPAGGRASVDGSSRYPRGAAAVASGLGHASGSSVLEVGLILLVCTPIVAVAVAAVSFRRRGDRRFALVGGIVLGVLALSSLVGVGVL